MTDQIADLLARIRNAVAVNKTELTIPASKMKEVILKIFEKEGFVGEIKPVPKSRHLIVSLSQKKQPVHIRQISKPGQRIYVKSKDIPKPLRGLGLIIISTPKGVISGREAAKQGVGGELICEVW